MTTMTAPRRWSALHPTVLRIEIARLLRNPRTLIFTLLFPSVLFLVFGSQQDFSQSVGNGNVAAYVAVSMALYGAALSASGRGAAVAVERAQGWTRQLRLTPLRPTAYVLAKTVPALLLGAVSVGVVFAVALVQGQASMTVGAWLGCAVLTVLSTLIFAALGLFLGYLVPSENITQVLGPVLVALSFIGNVFIPIDSSSWLWPIAAVTPMFGVAEISRFPLTGTLDWYAVVNAVAWLAIFVTGAAWRMSRDTSRV